MLNKQFINKISDFIEEKQLLSKAAKYIVALSGGADSVTLLYTLKYLGYNVEAAHCNFKLRGSESDRDETFCKELCRREDVKLHIVHFDTKEYAVLHKISIEMAARNLRYAYFEQLRKDIDADAICVAHHRDDSVETLLLNLIRGTGIHGLKGISVRNGSITRPLLCVSRKEIEDFMDSAGLDYVTDSTNLVDDVQRNKIRLNIIPMLKDINPAVCDNIFRTTQIVSEALPILDDFTDKSVKDVTSAGNGCLNISIERLCMQTSPEYTLYSILKQYGYTSSQTRQIYRTINAAPGRRFLSKTHRLLIDRKDIIIERREENGSKCLIIPETGVYIYNGNWKISIKTQENNSGFKINKSKNYACIDFSKVEFPLKIRKAAQGDRFFPFGMKGSKLVSNYMTDKKMTMFDKERQMVIEDATGRIVWLVNERPDNRFRIDGNTTEIMTIQCTKYQ